MELFFQNASWLVVLIIMLWVLPWKGYAMWTAARKSHKWWFIILLVINTFAILDIIYLFAVAKVQKSRRPKGSGGKESEESPDSASQNRGSSTSQTRRNVEGEVGNESGEETASPDK